MIYVDADACPVREETVRVAERHGHPVTFVSNGGIRPSRHPLVSIAVVTEGADAADKWIAERIAPRRRLRHCRRPPRRPRRRGRRRVLAPNGEPFTQANIGPRLATRDLLADLRAARSVPPGRQPSLRQGRPLPLPRRPRPGAPPGRRRPTALAEPLPSSAALAVPHAPSWGIRLR